MAQPTVVGIFDSPSDAEKVKDELLEAGVARHRIVVSRLLSEDDIGAEAPGQSYQNQQPGDDAGDSDWLGSVMGKTPEPHKFGEAVRRGACVVAVAARSHLDKKQIAELMRRNGARDTVERRA